MQKCRYCELDKPSECYKPAKYKPAVVCLDCLANPEIKKAQQRKHKDKNRLKQRLLIYNFLLEHPCVQCGETDPIVLDFDHLDPKEKSFNVSKAINHSGKGIIKEMEKCQVLCANCHRRKTAKQFNHFRYTYSLNKKAPVSEGLV